MSSQKKKAARKKKVPEESDDYLSDDFVYPSQIKRRRRFSVQETNRLEEEYSLNASPSQQKLQQIANEIGTARKIVTTWFQNRRAKHKRNGKKERREETTLKDQEIGLSQDFVMRGDAPLANDTHKIFDIYYPPEVCITNTEYTTDPSIMYHACMHQLQHYTMFDPLVESRSWMHTTEEGDFLPGSFSIEPSDGSLYINPSQLLLNHHL